MELVHEKDQFDIGQVSTWSTPDTPGSEPVSRIHNDSPIDHMTSDQKSKVGRFYELLANAMPLEGRDYQLEFKPGPDGKSVMSRVIGLNDLGTAFSRQVIDFWKRFGIKV